MRRFLLALLLVSFSGSAAATTVDAIEYYHAGFDHYFMTSVPGEITALDGGAFGGVWSRTGQKFRVHLPAGAPAGSVPTCRFFNDHFAPKSSHFYAAHGFGCEDTLQAFPDWQLEDAGLFATMLPDGAGNCPAGTIPVQRLYNNGQGGAPNHRFTTSSAVRQTMIDQGWAPEGVALCAEGINPFDRNSVINAFNQIYLASTPAMQWTGDISSCIPGTTSLAYQQRMIDQINFYREMAGLKPASLIANLASSQAGALMIKANNALSHNPPSTWKCYTSSGASSLGRSNVGLGWEGVTNIDGYMEDQGEFNTAAGHRAWFLKRSQSGFATGDVPGANTIDVHAVAATNTFNGEFVTWPSQGYFPYELLPTLQSNRFLYGRWSFSVLHADYSQAQVVMRNVTDGTDLPVSFEPLAVGFGDGNLVWVPTRNIIHERPAHDTIIDVTVSNILVDGVNKSYHYQVTLIDPH